MSIIVLPHTVVVTMKCARIVNNWDINKFCIHGPRVLKRIKENLFTSQEAIQTLCFKPWISSLKILDHKKKIEIFKNLKHPKPGISLSQKASVDQLRNEWFWQHLLMKLKEESEKVSLKCNIQKMKILAFGPITSWRIDEETWEQSQTYFLGLQNHCGWWLQPWNQKTLAPWKKINDKPRQHVKKQIHHFTNKDLYNQSYGFSSSHVWMWELNHKEGWVQKAWCIQTWRWRRLFRVCWTARSNQ